MKLITAAILTFASMATFVLGAPTSLNDISRRTTGTCPGCVTAVEEPVLDSRDKSTCPGCTTTSGAVESEGPVRKARVNTPTCPGCVTGDSEVARRAPAEPILDTRDKGTCPGCVTSVPEENTRRALLEPVLDTRDSGTCPGCVTRVGEPTA